LRQARVNGPGGALFAAIGLDFQGNRVNGIYAILNPDKLADASRRVRPRCVP
jgi:hypothetical protein